VFSLDGMYERAPATAWFITEPDQVSPPPEDEATVELVNTDESLDAVVIPD
jgi:hypothetical protein